MVLLESLGELVDGWGHLKTLHKDALLSLDSDVCGPLKEAGQVTGGLNVTTEAEVPGVLLEKRSGTSGG